MENMAEEKKEGVFGLFKKKEPEGWPKKGPISIPKEKEAHKEKYREGYGKGYPQIINYKGIFNFIGLYKMMVRWLKSRKFEFHEKLYKERPPEILLQWLAERKVSGYLKHIINIDIHILDAEEIEVVQNGVRKKMMKGRMRIRLEMELLPDYPDIYNERKWNTNFQRILVDFFNKHIIRRELELTHWDVLYYEMLKLHAAIKDHLHMEARGHAYAEVYTEKPPA